MFTTKCMCVSYNLKTEVIATYGQRTRRQAMTQEQLVQKVLTILVSKPSMILYEYFMLMSAMRKLYAQSQRHRTKLQAILKFILPFVS